MLWVWFAVGFVISILGTVISSYKGDIVINQLKFDSEMMGDCILSIGAVITIIMLGALGINWCMQG